MTAEGLRQSFAAWVKSMRQAEYCKALLQLDIAAYLADEMVPAGYGVDLFGDGTIKPVDQCKMNPEPGQLDGDKSDGGA